MKTVADEELELRRAVTRAPERLRQGIAERQESISPEGQARETPSEGGDIGLGYAPHGGEAARPSRGSQFASSRKIDRQFGS